GVLRKRHCLFVPRNAAAEVAVIKITCVAADHGAVQRAAFEKLRVIAYRRLEHAEQNRNISHAPPHRPGCVLLMTDWDNSILRDKPQSRLQSNDVFNGGWSCDRSVGLRSDCRRTQVRGRARARTGAGSP